MFGKESKDLVRLHIIIYIACNSIVSSPDSSPCAMLGIAHGEESGDETTSATHNVRGRHQLA